MNVVVTGAAGFIGQHLTDHLQKEGHTITGIDLRQMMIYGFRGDITSDVTMDAIADVVKEGGVASPFGGKVDAIIHLAAVASPLIAQRDPVRAWSTNVHGTQNVLQLAFKVGCPRVIFFSSAHVYGISPKYLPTDENHPLALHDTYTTTKIIGEQLCRLYYENHGVAYTILRLWNAYGPGQSPDYFIGKKIAQASSEGQVTLRNENVTKDWVHVSDVVRATSMALKSGYVGPLNVGTGRETSLREIANAIAREFDVRVVKEDVPDEGPTRMCCDRSRIRNTIGWEPTVTFEEGLSDLISKSRKSADGSR